MGLTEYPKRIEKDFFLEMSKGNITGHTTFVMFGHNPDIDTGGPEDLWAQGGVITHLTSAETMDVVSSSTDDDSGGIGATSLLIIGLDGNYNEITESVVLNGISNITTTKSFLRINKVIANGAGSSEHNVGNIILTASTASTVQSYMEAEIGHSRSAHYTVPLGKTAYIRQAEFSSHKLSGGQSPEVEIEGLVFNPNTNVELRLFDEVMNTNVLERIFIANALFERLNEKFDLRVAA